MYYLTHLFILNACELGIVILILQVMKGGEERLNDLLNVTELLSSRA